jgi:hypothetical protein
MLQKIRFFDKKDPKLSLSELLSRITRIQIYSVQDYIYWIISTENDHRHHHKFIKYEKRLRKEGKTCSAYLSSKIFATSARVWMHSTSLSSFQRSNWSPTYILHLKQRFVAYLPIIRCLIFILWRSVRKTTIILGLKKLRLW